MNEFVGHPGVAPVDNEQSIGQLLRIWAERSPEAVAIAAPGRATLSYSRLWAQVEGALTALKIMGVGRSDRVAIVLPNGPEMAVAFLAVSSGATSAPLNPAYGTREFQTYLSDLGVTALLTEAGVSSPARAVAEELCVPIIELSANLEMEAGVFTLSGDERPSVAKAGLAEPGDVALVLHTSGTTSRPKLVPLPHANLCGSACNVRDAYQLTADDRCLNVMPLFHIHGLVAAILSTLASGGSVVCTPGLDPAQFCAWLEAYCPTWYTAVPTMHQAILDHAETNRGLSGHNPLRFIRSCSASLPPGVMAELERVFGVPALEAFGMTEAAHQISSNPLPPAPRKAGSVGVPTGTEVAIMDETGNLLGATEDGEIVIRGASVIQGYENNPGANEAGFVDGWFRTGDQGVLDEDGYLTITGRIKEMINRGGEKIAPREVEEALLEHPAVVQAVTFGIPHAALGEDVAAAVVLREGAMATEKELRERVLDRLAVFKVPSRVVILEELPKGPTGKLQRSGLYEKLAPRLRANYVAPRDDVELQVTKIWEQVLGVHPIGVKDSFFDLGGHSLQIARLLAQIEEAFGIAYSPSAFFGMPTVEQTANILRDGEAPIHPISGGENLPGGSGQRKDPLWSGLKNRILQVLALYAPGRMTTRVWLHRMRGVRFGNGVSIGVGAIIEGAYPRLVSIGNNVHIGVRSVIIAHVRCVNIAQPRGTDAMAGDGHEPTVRIEDNVYIGPGVIVLPSVTIGQGAVVAAGSVVNRSVPPLTMVQGNPAKAVAHCGIPLMGEDYGRFILNLEIIEE